MTTSGLSVSLHKFLPRPQSLAGSLPFIQQVLNKGLHVPAIGPGSGDLKMRRRGSPERSSEPRCGSKYGIGETRVGLVSLLADPHYHEKFGQGGGSQGGLPGGGDTLKGLRG